MKKGLTEMIFILDRSGSMNHLAQDTIGGFNSMIEKQKEEPGEAYVTTVLFSDDYNILHDHINLKEVKPITNKEYYAMGLTALVDAIGKTIDDIGNRLSNTPEEERPEKVIFMITTDGFENASYQYTKSKVKEMIEHQQNKYSWVFMFLGANMDAVSEAATYGISSDFAATYSNSATGIDSVYQVTSHAMSAVRDMNMSDFASTDCLCSMVSESFKDVK